MNSNKISLVGIARLANVARSTVSMWRSRYNDDSATPFPQALHTSGKQPWFDSDEVAQWLVGTGHGHNADAVADAPFYSDLFDQVLGQSEAAASLLQRWDETSSNGSGLAVSLRQLVEAAFGPGPVLEKMHDRLTLNHPGKLHNKAVDVIGSALAAVVDTQQSSSGSAVPTISPWGTDCLQLVVNLARRYQDEVPFEVVDSSTDSTDSHAYVAWAELRSRHIVERKNCPAHAIILGVWVENTEKQAAQFFDDLDDKLADLGPEGAAIIIAPVDLLFGQQMNSLLRRRFLADTETGYVAPLRYSARLPRSWAVNLGQRQLGLWIFKRPTPSKPGNQAKHTVAIAELSGLTEQNHAEVISDLATVVLSADEMAKHTFFQARFMQESQAMVALRDDRLTLDTWFTKNAAPSRVLGDLMALADQAGVALMEEFSVEDTETDNLTFERISWNKATKGKSRVLDILPGVRIADDAFGDTGDGTVAVIGKAELTGAKNIGDRRIDRLRLEAITSRAVLTEPGDVVFIKQRQPVALVDSEGGHVVQTPAQIARCRSTWGRSQRKLDYVTTPFFTAKAINSASRTDPSSWLVPIVKADQLVTFRELHYLVEQRRQQLAGQLAALEKFESQAAVALASGSIRAGPKHDQISR